MEGLRDLDSVAYVRFASVHRDFSSLDVMEEEIKRIKERANQKDYLSFGFCLLMQNCLLHCGTTLFCVRYLLTKI